ncbi:MAG: hypothetical protein QXS85_01820 [Acidilobaceae archaeon]
MRLAAVLAGHGVKVYLWDWPPLYEILSESLPRFLNKLDIARHEGEFSSVIIALRSDDELRPLWSLLERSRAEVLLNMSYLSVALARRLHELALRSGWSYLEAQLVRLSGRDVLVISGSGKVPEVLENALKSLSSNIISIALPPGSLIALKWLLSLFSEGLMRREEFFRLLEMFDVKTQLVERLLGDLRLKQD